MADDQNNAPSSEPISTANPYEYLKITLHPDGTVTRGLVIPTAPPSANPSDTTTAALSKDLPINPQKSTYARLYLPKFALNNPHYYNKLPLVIYFHGGGFVLLIVVESKLNHDFCEQVAAAAPALVVSVEYRLAPEHRLPAAYDDAVEALTWIKESVAQIGDEDDENWISRYGDLSSCFLMGTSAGGNIAYFAGLRAAAGLDLGPVRIRGMILHTPALGGMDRTESEKRLANDPILPVAGTDLLLELALPEGADRDHEYSNPVKSGGPGQLDRVRELGWKVLVTGCSGDPLFDRQVELAKFMEESGVGVVAYMTEGGYHGVELKDPAKTRPFMEVVKDFILSTP